MQLERGKHKCGFEQTGSRYHCRVWQLCVILCMWVKQKDIICDSPCICDTVCVCVCVWLEARIPPKPNEAVDHRSVSSWINPQAGPMFCVSEPALISQTHWSTTAQSSPVVQYWAQILFIFWQIKVRLEHEILSLFPIIESVILSLHIIDLHGRCVSIVSTLAVNKAALMSFTNCWFRFID